MEDIRELIEFARTEWPDLFHGKGIKWPDQKPAPQLARAKSPVNYPAPKMKSILDLDKEP